MFLVISGAGPSVETCASPSPASSSPRAARTPPPPAPSPPARAAPAPAPSAAPRERDARGLRGGGQYGYESAALAAGQADTDHLQPPAIAARVDWTVARRRAGGAAAVADLSTGAIGIHRTARPSRARTGRGRRLRLRARCRLAARRGRRRAGRCRSAARRRATSSWRRVAPGKSQRQRPDDRAYQVELAHGGRGRWPFACVKPW